jgi:hypothetical protein
MMWQVKEERKEWKRMKKNEKEWKRMKKNEKEQASNTLKESTSTLSTRNQSVREDTSWTGTYQPHASAQSSNGVRARRNAHMASEQASFHESPLWAQDMHVGVK